MALEILLSEIVPCFPLTEQKQQTDNKLTYNAMQEKETTAHTHTHACTDMHTRTHIWQDD